MGFEIILSIVIFVVVILFILSFIAGLFMFNITMIPGSPRNYFNKKEEDIDEQVKEFFASSEQWVKENTTSVWSLTSFDNLNLKSVFVENKGSHKWVILVHGYTSRGWHMAQFAKQYYETGFNILMPDLRGHGDSEGQYATMGYYDSVDIIGWIREIIKKDSDAKIVLHGISMGAATVMLTTGEDLSNHVKCAIEDCGYTSVWDIFSYNMKRFFKLPAFPVLYVSNIISRARVRMDFKQASPLNAVKKSKTPTLFIHGDADELVPFYMLEPLYDNAACEKDILVVKGAEHGASSAKEPDVYHKKVSEFISKYLN